MTRKGYLWHLVSKYCHPLDGGHFECMVINGFFSPFPLANHRAWLWVYKVGYEGGQKSCGKSCALLGPDGRRLNGSVGYTTGHMFEYIFLQGHPASSSLVVDLVYSWLVWRFSFIERWCKVCEYCSNGIFVGWYGPTSLEGGTLGVVGTITLSLGLISLWGTVKEARENQMRRQES